MQKSNINHIFENLPSNKNILNLYKVKSLQSFNLQLQILLNGIKIQHLYFKDPIIVYMLL